MSLNDAVRAMANQSSDDVVGLVVRFNNDDTKTSTIYSESPNTVATPGNPGAADRAAHLFRIDRYDQNQPHLPGHIRVSATTNDASGFHAEEILIMSWPSLISQHGLTEDTITTADLVLSKSPCYGQSGSAPIIIGAAGQPQTRYNVGCANKLTHFCGTRSDVKFKVLYIALAGARAGTYGLNSIRGPGVKSLMTHEERALDDARTELPGSFAARQNAAADQRQAQTNLANATTAIQNFDGERSSDAFGQLIGDISTARRDIKSANKTHKRAEDAERQNRVDGRHQSRETAQQGIVRLSSLFNVDVERWR